MVPRNSVEVVQSVRSAVRLGDVPRTHVRTAGCAYVASLSLDLSVASYRSAYLAYL